MSVYIIPIFFAIILLIAISKRFNTYNIFVNGAKNAINLCVGIFPLLVAIFIMVELLSASGVMEFFVSKTQSVWKFLGIPSEVIELILLKPFTGSGSIALLTNVYTKYGTNSYIANCASIIMGTSDTLFYILVVYFGTIKIKKTGAIIPIALASCFIGNLFACLICKLF